MGRGSGRGWLGAGPPWRFSMTSSASSDLAKVKLNGVISDFADATSFVVRGIPVDASGINGLFGSLWEEGLGAERL